MTFLSSYGIKGTLVATSDVNGVGEEAGGGGVGVSDSNVILTLRVTTLVWMSPLTKALGFESLRWVLLRLKFLILGQETIVKYVLIGSATYS